MFHGSKDVKIRELTSEKTIYVLIVKKEMEDIKKQLEIVFSTDTSTLKMIVEHFKFQQPIVENNKLKDEKQTERTKKIIQEEKKYL